MPWWSFSRRAVFFVSLHDFNCVYISPSERFRILIFLVLPQMIIKYCVVVSNMCYFHPDPWGFMIQFDLRIFFKWVGSTTN